MQKTSAKDAHIIFTGLGYLEPQADMTTVESLRIASMMAMAAAGSNVDFVEFADLHGLRRHFSLEPK